MIQTSESQGSNNDRESGRAAVDLAASKLDALSSPTILSYDAILRSSKEIFGRQFTDSYKDAAIGGPARGFERPYTVDVIRSGLEFLPEPLKSSFLHPAKPSILYGCYLLPLDPCGGFPASLRYEMRAAQTRSGERCAILEIQLFDFPCSLGFGKGSRARKEALFLPSAIYNSFKVRFGVVKSERLLMGSRDVQIENDRIREALPSLTFDLIANESVLHEVGALVWKVLPQALRDRWSSVVYPLEPIPEHSGIYYRCRWYSGGNLESFAEETFCDKFARYLLGAFGSMLDSVGRPIRNTEQDFMQVVLEHFGEKYKQGKLLSELPANS